MLISKPPEALIKERIYRQALRTIVGIKTDLPYTTIYLSDALTIPYQFYIKAGMNDKAEEIAQKGIAVIDEVNSPSNLRCEISDVDDTPGQIYLKNGNLLKAESILSNRFTGSC